MRTIRSMLAHLGRRDAPVPLAVPPPLPAREVRELREAQVRIPRKWAAFDRMIADYDGGDHALAKWRRR